MVLVTTFVQQCPTIINSYRVNLYSVAFSDTMLDLNISLLKRFSWFHDFCSERTVGGTFWVLALVESLLAKVEEVGGTWSFASMLQFMISEFIYIAAAGNRRSSGFRMVSDVFDLLGEMPPFFFFSFLSLFVCIVAISVMAFSEWILYPETVQCLLSSHVLDAWFWLEVTSTSGLDHRIPRHPVK